ncbi:hypothetical protein ODJ79_25550 [Actinoplanes sp. KI2]|uniref:hypothetical protein n=1 Tax=Actinoplanes sp. KI2 TaxID=2983315 RepID=UPI0021D585C3|nr:hypothetical protein [Actinoplanes sp. KI2]MCU7727107.1 hypothetical protein [Actinoplanes sp. KI2]
MRYPGEVMCADSVGRTLLAVAVPPAQRRGGGLLRVPVLGRFGELSEERRRLALTSEAVAEAVPAGQIDDVDAAAVAAWIVEHYRQRIYPAVALGSPHGAAVHLAAGCGAAWLPTSFTITAPWPGGSPGNWPGAMDWGSKLAERLVARNPDVTVRQVHDPVLRGPLCGATVSLHVQWRTLPVAYRSFLRSRLAPNGAAVLVRDVRTWPVLDGSPGHSFQIGTPTGGWKADCYSTGEAGFRRLLCAIGVDEWPDPVGTAPRRYAETSGDPALGPELCEVVEVAGGVSCRVLYRDSQALSAGVADVLRRWLRPRTGAQHCVVGTGRMADPWRIIAGGMVPYWCESSSRSATQAAELWLAGSEPFERISVLPEPPGTLNDDTATLSHWRSVAGFARGCGRVDSLVARRYPMLPPAPGHASRFPEDTVLSPPIPVMPMEQAVRRLAVAARSLGLLIV